jgi:hypothetical protein
MSSLAFLVTELQVCLRLQQKPANIHLYLHLKSLASESRRKHPEIREVRWKALIPRTTGVLCPRKGSRKVACDT